MRKGRIGRSNPAHTMMRVLHAGATRLRPLADRRRAGRIKGTGLRCNRGRVIDLSSGGMRLRSPRRLRGELEVELWTRIRRLDVRAKVVWTTRVGFRKYNIGLQFRDVTPDAARELTAFAAYLQSG